MAIREIDIAIRFINLIYLEYLNMNFTCIILIF